MKTRFKRSQIRLLSFNVALIAVLGILAYTNIKKANEYEMQIQSSQQMALSNLGEYVDNIYIDLKKGIYANTPAMMNTFSSSLWTNTTGAKNNLAQLSVNGPALANTYKFLSQVSDFTIALNKRVALEQTITDSQRKDLYKLLNYSKDLSAQIDEMRTGINDGTIDISKSENNLSIDKSDKQVKTLQKSFSSVEQSLVDYPSLIYDGPFSDQNLNKTPKFTAGKAQITEDQAKSLASKYSGISVGKLKRGSDDSGNLPCYAFISGDVTISVTKAGGYLSYIINSNYADKAKYQVDEAISIANKYLTDIGYTDMTSSYYEIVDGICTINFAYKADNIIYYPDLIKIGVGLDSGKVLSVDARSYLMNHYARTLPIDILSEQDAKSKLSPLLTVQSVQRAVIPTDDSIERYCYEFTCKGRNKDNVLVYIDCEKGIERDLLLLIQTGTGSLTK